MTFGIDDKVLGSVIQPMQLAGAVTQGAHPPGWRNVAR